MAQEVQGMLIRLEATTAQMRQELARADATVSATSTNIDRRLGVVDGAFSRLGMSAQAMSRVLSGAFAAVSVSALASQADAYANMASRLKLVTTTAQEFNEAQKAVFDIAQSSYQPLSATAELYQRIATNQKELGLSGKEVAGIVGTISKSMAVSGASAASANAALIQLGQAFASGVLRGEELNSVMEQAPALAQAIAAGMGKTVGELRSLGAEGKLTADAVVKALQSQAGAVDALFAKTNTTIGNSLTAMGNSTTRFIGELDQAAQASAGMAQGILKLSKAMDESLPQALTFARENSGALEQAMTTGLYAALARVAGGFAQQGAQAVNAAAKSQALRKETLETAKANQTAAETANTAARADLFRANQAVDAAHKQVAADKQKAASELDRARSVQAGLVVEREAEMLRHQAQISEKGRAASQARIIEINRAHIAVTAQVGAAERALASITTATSAQVTAAYETRTAAVAAYGLTTSAVNLTTVATTQAAAAASLTARAWASLTSAGTGLLGMMGGPLGLLFITGAVAISFADFRSNTDKAREGLQNLTGPLDDVISRFKQLTRDQQAAALVKWSEAQADATKAANDELRNLESTLKDGLVGTFSRKAGGTTLFMQVKSDIESAVKAGRDLSPIIENLKDSGVPQETIDSALKFAGAHSAMASAAREAGDRQGQLRKMMEDSGKAQVAAAQATKGLTAAGQKHVEELQKRLGKLQDNNDAVKEANRYIAEHTDLSEADKKAILSTAYAIEAQEKANKANAKAVRDSNKAYQEDSGQKMLDDAKQRYAVLLEQKDAIEGQADGSRALGVEAKRLIQLEQEIAQLKEKKTLTAAQKQVLAMADLNVAQQKQNAELEKANELTKIQLENKAKLVSFQEQLNEQLQLAKEGLDVEVAGIGMGQKQRQRLQEDLRIRGDYQKQLAKLQRDYQNIVNPTAEQRDLYEQETAAVKDALDERLRYQADYYSQLDQAQANWANGANAAWQDYINEASDIAGQTYDVFSNAFQGMEDALVEFAMTGKLSFKELANSIIADIARIVVRTKIVSPLLNSLFGGGGGGGGIASAIAGGGSGGGFNLESAWNTVSGAYSVATSGFGSAVSAGWTAGEGFLGGVQGAFKAGAGYLSSSIGGLFAGSSGTMVNGVYQLGASAAPATVDLISNTVTNSATGAVTGTATGATTAATSGLAASSALMYGIGGAIQGYLKAGVKGAVAGAGGAVAGAYAGAAIGSAVPIIGNVIGAAIGAVLGGLFGSSLFGGDWITKDEGFQLGVTDGDLESYSFEYQKKKGGLFSSNKKRTRLTAMDEEMQAALDSTYATTLGSVIGLFDSLDVTLNDAVLDGLNVAATQISTRDKTAEEIQKEIADWFTVLADAAVGEVNKVTGSGLDGFNFESLTTFVSNLYSVNTSLDMIGVKMVDFNIAGGRAVENLVSLAGGIENLNKNMTTFYDNFTTDTQKSADVLDGVRAQFLSMGLTLPATREAFAEAVKGLDMTSEAERKIFNSMTANAEQAAAAYTILEARQQAYYSAFYSEAENTARSLNSTIAQVEALGVTLPATRNGFRQMVEALDLTTEKGKATHDSLMSLAGAVGAVYDNIEQQLLGNANAAFATLQRSINAQKTSINDMITTARESASGLTSISNALSNALKALRGDGDDAVRMLRDQAKATVVSALSIAKAGGSLSKFEGLEDALGVISDSDTSLYSSLEDFNREQGRNANLIAELNGLNGKQLSASEKTIKALEDQLVGLDKQLEFAQQQMDALNGVDNSVKTVAQAIAEMNAAVVAAIGTISGKITAQNAGTLVDSIYQDKLGRPADAGGKQYWVDQLTGGSLNAGNITGAITNAAAIEAAYKAAGIAMNDGAAYWATQLTTGALTPAQLQEAVRNAALANGQLPKYATGGLISGPGTGTSDSILARLSNGEYVMSADAVRMFGTGLLDQMNAGRLPGFAVGGGVGETGPVLQITRPAQIYAQRIDQGRGQVDTGAATVAELRELRREMQESFKYFGAQLRETASNTDQMANGGVQIVGTVETKAATA